jgi:hypothetical protein
MVADAACQALKHTYCYIKRGHVLRAPSAVQADRGGSSAVIAFLVRGSRGFLYLTQGAAWLAMGSFSGL